MNISVSKLTFWAFIGFSIWEVILGYKLLASIDLTAAMLLVAIESIIDNNSNKATTSDGKINLYDEVFLNSGGPRMLVVSIDGNNVACTWVNDNGVFDRDEFKSACVRKFENDKPELA
jgi:uncharacterized protein YodC (DUF2158 family)